MDKAMQVLFESSKLNVWQNGLDSLNMRANTSSSIEPVKMCHDRLHFSCTGKHLNEGRIVKKKEMNKKRTKKLLENHMNSLKNRKVFKPERKVKQAAAKRFSSFLLKKNNHSDRFGPKMRNSVQSPKVTKLKSVTTRFNRASGRKVSEKLLKKGVISLSPYKKESLRLKTVNNEDNWLYNPEALDIELSQIINSDPSVKSSFKKTVALESFRTAFAKRIDKIKKTKKKLAKPRVTLYDKYKKQNVQKEKTIDTRFKEQFNLDYIRKYYCF